MAAVQIERGPDEQNIWLSEDQKLGLAHQRLSIIDLSSSASQPMHDSSNRFSIIYNGEIYNFQELRQQCEQLGETFISQSDTEVLLIMYRLYAEKMLDMLRGMYAFAIWDNEQQSLFLARDPLGIKPLYYLNDDGEFRFASQVRALQAIEQQIVKDQTAEAGFLLFGSIPEPDTYESGVKAVPAGHYLLFKNGECKQQKFWDVSKSYKAVESNKDFTQCASDAIQESVRVHMVSDVPVGIFLSSGLDSAAVAACMRSYTDQEIVAITLRYEEYVDTPDDETQYARKIAERYNLTHHIYTVSKQEFEADMPLLLNAMDQPTIDGINVWFVAKAAKKLGLKVAMSGLGGDELLGGYPSFRNLPKWTKWCRVLSKLPFGKSLLIMVLRLMKQRISIKAKYMLDYGNDFPGAYLLQRAIYLPDELTSFMSEKQAEESLVALDWHRRFSELTNQFDHVELKTAALESCWYMRHQLLRDADWAGMAHSIEIRTPLVDKVLIEALAPYRQKLIKQSGKWPLANLLDKDLAETLLARPKTGFTLPMADWLETTITQNRLSEHWSRLYIRKLHARFFRSEAI